MSKRRIAPDQRRRDRRILAKLAAAHHVIYLRHEPDFRSARRLMRAGLCCAVASKCRPWMRRLVAEIALFRTRAEALREYGAESIMRDK